MEETPKAEGAAGAALSQPLACASSPTTLVDSGAASSPLLRETAAPNEDEPSAKRVCAAAVPRSFSVASMPSALSIRVRQLKPRTGPTDACSFVLYWCRTALRAHDNPALCVVARASSALALPVLVLLTFEGGSRCFDTARRASFYLEGLASAAAAFRARGFAVAVKVQTKADKAPVVLTLSHRAALVVVDEPFGLEPWLTSTNRLAACGCSAPVLAVDAACVAPVGGVSPSAARGATPFAKATQNARDNVLRGAAYSDAPYDPSSLPPVPSVPFSDTPLDDIPSLVAACDVDHSVVALAHTPGGCAAASARWARWKAAGGLRRYKADRCNPARPAGASRMVRA